MRRTRQVCAVHSETDDACWQIEELLTERVMVSSELRVLRLRKCGIRSLPASTLDVLPALTELDLRENKISEVFRQDLSAAHRVPTHAHTCACPPLPVTIPITFFCTLVAER